MNLAQNQALKIFLTSFLILFLAIVIMHFVNYKNVTNDHLKLSTKISKEISLNLENIFLEKVKTVKTMSISPTIFAALQKSNKYYGKFTEQHRVKEIQAKNNRWKNIKDPEDPFILQYTNNEVSKFLKRQQKEIKGEYGEIFVTDKFGALIASTAKLTTFSHSDKYWWEGAYNKGEGAVFFDDRGFDKSVGGYVLGVVVPIKNGEEIIGIIKANLNILGSINKMILNGLREDSKQVSLIRSGGLIIYREDLEPLSKRIPEEILEQITQNESFILQVEGLEGIYAASEIEITAGKTGHLFGGRFESSDDKKVNTGESWYVLAFQPMSHIVKPVKNNFRILLIIGAFLSIVLAFITMIVGNTAAKSIKNFIKQTLKISEGDYNTEVITKRHDEIGQLATSFNKMTNNLKKRTTSLDSLNREKIEHQKTESALLEAAKNWQTTFNASRDVIWVLNKDQEIIQSNQIVKKIIGKPIEDILGKNCHSIVHNTKEPISACPFVRTRKSLRREFMELKIGEKWFEVTTDPILDEDNKFNGAVHIIRDITNRKHIADERNAALKELELVNKVILNVNNENHPNKMAEIIAEAVYEVNPNSLVAISLYDKQLGGVQIKSLVGLDKTQDKFIKILGKDPRKIKFDPQKLDKVYTIYSSGKLTLVKGGLAELMAGHISEAQCRITEKLMNIGAVYTAGFASTDTVKGGVVILLKKGQIIQSKSAIESILTQTSQVIQRRQVEQENQIKSRELEKEFVKSEKQRIANLVILNDLNKTTKRLKLEAIERKKAEEQIQKDLHQKNILLQELYHRTKNNMQVISSMMNMEARQSNDPIFKKSIKEITSKINTMALVHQKLYQSNDLSKINLREYIEDLSDLVIQGYYQKASKISFKYNMDDVYVLLDTVMPLGLVLNELLSNAFKHAFPKDTGGEICINMKLDNQGMIYIELSDSGIGIPEDLDLRQFKSMGLMTMFSLIEHQLQGSIDYESKNGLIWRIRFNDSINTERV